MKRRVLILCTANSARSQMAEGLLRHDRGGEFEVASAGARATRVRPEAIAALGEIGIDLSGHRSKAVDEFAGQTFDYVLTVCDNARESCPVYAGHGRRIHRNFEDPAAVDGPDEQRLAAFRRVRDEIRAYLRHFEIRVRPAGPEDRAAVAALLAEAKLVALDEAAQFGPQYAVAVDEQGAVIGAAGVERYGADGLLRSVVVAPAWQKRGIGGALVEDRLAWARQAGLTSLYLLTTTAAGYWARAGFVPVERAGAPAGLAASAEWASACPASATSMKREVEQPI